jgi:hypothetical protein
MSLRSAIKRRTMNTLFPVMFEISEHALVCDTMALSMWTKNQSLETSTSKEKSGIGHAA